MFCNRDKMIDIWQGALAYDIIFRRACCTMYKHRPFASGFNKFLSMVKYRFQFYVIDEYFTHSFSRWKIQKSVKGRM
jgi:hypothetical protein